jgi:AcrR family transcriptional regulator
MAGAKRAVARKGEARQAEVLAMARRVLVEEGYDRFSLRDIATRVGVTLGNLQYYFPARDDLLEAVLRAELVRDQAELAALAAAARSPRDALAAVVRHLIEEWTREARRVYVVLSLLALHQPRFSALHREIYEGFYDALVPLLRGLRPDAKRVELLQLARMITILIDGAVLQGPGRGLVADSVDAVLRVAAPEEGAPRSGSSRAQRGRRVRSRT